MIELLLDLIGVALVAEIGIVLLVIIPVWGWFVLNQFLPKCDVRTEKGE